MTEDRLRMVVGLMLAVLVVACGREPPFECSDAIGCVDIPPGEPIKLGVIQALSRGPALAGATQVRTIELAVAQREGHLLGHPISLITEDDYCSPEGGTTAALKITADPDVVAIVGTTCSGAAATASKVMSEAGLVMVSGGNSAPSLTSIGGRPGADWYPGFFRTYSQRRGPGPGSRHLRLRGIGLHQSGHAQRWGHLHPRADRRLRPGLQRTRRTGRPGRDRQQGR